jgi:hypothetical protein
MKHIFHGLAATLLLIATHVTAWAGIPPDMAEKLMRKSGAWAQLADVPAQVRAGIANAPMRSQLLPLDLARLERSADAAFSTDRLRSSALRVLAAELSPSHATEAMDWYSSPTGLMITALEEAASHEFTDLNAALQDGNTALAAATPERQTLIIRLVRATRSVDSSVNTMVHSMAGLAQGMSSVLPNQKAPALAELYASMQSQRPQLIASATGMCNAMAAASYVTLSDGELQQYLGFLSTTAGQRLVDAMVKALDKAFYMASRDLGRRIVQRKVPANL